MRTGRSRAAWSSASRPSEREAERIERQRAAARAIRGAASQVDGRRRRMLADRAFLIEIASDADAVLDLLREVEALGEGQEAAVSVHNESMACIAEVIGPAMGRGGNNAAAPSRTAAAGAVDAARVDLVERIHEGIPEHAYVPGCGPWLLRGKRYLLYAPSGVGKSLAASVVAVEVVRRGGMVAIIDVENGADEYARRLAAILGDDRDLAEACAERLRYFEYPTLAWSGARRSGPPRSRAPTWSSSTARGTSSRRSGSPRTRATITPASWRGW
jgi:Rad3-related DNA helicase